MNMHVGARGGGEMMNHFRDLIDVGKQDPENLRSALTEIRDYAERVKKEGGNKAVQGTTETPAATAPKATHRFNPSTGKIEPIQ
jgi:hypothetical protein